MMAKRALLPILAYSKTCSEHFDPTDLYTLVEAWVVKTVVQPSPMVNPHEMESPETMPPP